MHSSSRSLAFPQDSGKDFLSAFRIALDLFGRADLENFLPARDHPRYLEILGELVRHDLAHGWRVGAPTALSAYQAKHPELFADPEFVLKLTHDELRLRAQDGAAPSLGAHRERFSALDGDTPPTVAAVRPRPGQPDPEDQPRVSAAELHELEGDFDRYPLTAHRAISDPMEETPVAESGQTRPGFPNGIRPSGQQPSEPEIALKLKEALFEMPKVGDDFLGFGLLAELGKGAFGSVFLAQQGALAGRLVALKVATGLFGESQTLAQLQHTHIVPIYSYHHAVPFQAVCMPYLGSTTLADVLRDIRAHKSMPASGKNILSTLNERKRKSTARFEDSSRVDSSRDPDAPPGEPATASKRARPVPSPLLELSGLNYVDSILWLAVRLTDGLAHAHERGIMHRDLKPANILLTDEGVPMLLDFNLAQDTKLRDSAAAASIGGTLPYMAPEHLAAFRGDDDTTDARSDLYSIGVILFELLTGAAPFSSYRKLPMREIVERMIKDRHEGAPSLRLLNPTIPHAVEALILKCIAADPAQRYQSARDLQEDLQRQLAQQPLKHAPNPSFVERLQKFRRRHPRVTSTTSVLLIAALFFTGLASLFVVREERRLRLEARETLTRFDDDAQTTYFLLNARSAKDQLEEGERTCRATLAHFQVLDNPNWRETNAVKRLPAADQERLQGEIGQLLVVLANALQLAAEREKDPARQQALLGDGVQFCSLASDCFPADKTPQALWKQQGELFRRRGERDKAEAAFQRAREAKLQTAQDRYLTARQLAEEGKFRDALPLIREGIRLAPNDFNLNFLQGICHDYLAQHAEAIECYRTCIALRPRFHASYYNRGLAYLRQQNWKLAKDDFDHVLQLKEDFAPTHLHRALAHQGMKNHREAEADFTTALEHGSDQTRVYFMRARLRDKAGNAAGAKADMAEGMRREPADDLSWIARGLAFLPGDPKRALSDFEKALELNPRSQAALQNKAHVLGKYFKRTEDAIKTLDAALQLYPDDAALRAGRGVYHARLGKRDLAIKDAEQALLRDTNPPNLYQVAGIYALTSRQENDDRQEAFRLLSAALKKGFGFEYLEIDRDLDPIRDMPAFRRVVDAAKALHAPAGKR